MAKPLDAGARAAIAKVIPLLSSDKAGEVAAAAAAIGRYLAKAGASWNDLADHVKAGGGLGTVSDLSDAVEAEIRRRSQQERPWQYSDQDSWLAEWQRARARMDEAMKQAAPKPRRKRSRPFGDQTGEDSDGFAARTSAEFKARQGKRPTRGNVWAVELQRVCSDIERADASSATNLDEKSFTFLQQLANRCSRYDSVRLSSRQDAWLRSLARAASVEIPWERIEDEVV